MSAELKHVDEKYLNKYFRERSVFKRYKKYLARSIAAAMVIFTIFLTAAAAGVIWSGSVLISNIGEEGYFVGVIIFLFFVLVTAGCVAMLLVLSKDARKPVDHWVELAAKDGGYAVSHIQEFERQAMETDSLLVPTAAMFAKTFRNGFLTKDYICFMGLQNRLQVAKCTDITEAYLNTYSFPVMGTYRKMYDLHICLFTKHGEIITTDITKKAGNLLQDILKERYPHIDTKDGTILSEKEFGQWLDQRRSQ